MSEYKWFIIAPWSKPDDFCTMLNCLLLCLKVKALEKQVLLEIVLVMLPLESSNFFNSTACDRIKVTRKLRCYWAESFVAVMHKWRLVIVALGRPCPCFLSMTTVSLNYFYELDTMPDITLNSIGNCISDCVVSSLLAIWNLIPSSKIFFVLIFNAAKNCSIYI